ncbi:MAG: uracil-DNA glycosylase [Candidatus Thiodiazotropha endolucinida]
MKEPRRIHYLKAMGLTLWQRRIVAKAGRGDESREGTEDARAVDSETGVAHSDPIDETAPALEARVNPELDDWQELQQSVKRCKVCGLRAGCTQTVFGVGNPQAELLVIGEAPGADEDRQGEPFVGRAGQLLNGMLLAMGYKREAVFIANIVKCRPPNNRDPKPEEALSCEPYLQRQIELIKPKVILAVGRISAQNLLKTDIAVGKLRGRIHSFGNQGIPLVVTYHPAYLLRSPEQKGKAWQDLQLALSVLRGDRA